MGKDDDQAYMACFSSFLHQYCQDRITEILKASNEYDHYSVPVVVTELIDYTPILAQGLLSHPDEILPLFNKALLQIQRQDVFNIQPESEDQIVPCCVKMNSHIRLEYLPPVEPITKMTISTIRSSDVGKLIQLSGTVIRTGAIRMLEVSREYQCSSGKCLYRFQVFSDPAQGHLFDLPRVCSGCKKSTRFELIPNSTVCSDYQEIKIQEQVEKLTIGSIPRSLIALVQDDLVDSIKAGDNVTVVGVLIRRWKPTYPDVRCELESVLQVNSIRIRKGQMAQTIATAEHIKEFQDLWLKYKDKPLAGRNFIIQSICPQVIGLFPVKLAVLLTVIGGCSNVDANGLKIRGEPHMLLIGDPGTGKSQFLRFTSELATRSVLTTGIGTTSAGLTCTAVKEHGEWALEAGALVLADRGICCIDEFSGIRSADRSSIHEAMEQQTLSVAKAGLVCKLNTRTSVFAVTNPKGKYDLNENISVNTAIASPLLSRFDIILVLLDTPNAEWDKIVSSFILSDALVEKTTSHQQWSLSKLQAYINWIKETFQPKVTAEAIRVLERYYQLQRASDVNSSARTTIRLLESLTRLSQAHARLMAHEQVQVSDAVMAVYMVEASMATTSMLGITSVLHTDFPMDPDADFAAQQEIVLRELNLQ